MTQVPTITASTTDFLLNTASSTSVGSDNFILQVNGFSQNGTPVTIPGLNSSFGLYVEGTVALHGNPSIYGPGTVALVLDPTNNDGTPSATWDPATQSGSVGFSNLVNTTDDIVLATGSVISGTFGTQSNGQVGLQLLETFKLNPSVFGPFLSKLSTSLDLQETLFNTATSRIAGSTNDGGSYVTVNDGFGIVGFTAGSSGASPAGGTDLFSNAAAGHAIAEELVAALNIADTHSSASVGSANSWSGGAAGGAHDPTNSWMAWIPLHGGHGG